MDAQTPQTQGLYETGSVALQKTSDLFRTSLTHAGAETTDNDRESSALSLHGYPLP